MAYSGTRLDAAMGHVGTGNEVQSVVLTGDPEGGTFTLEYDSEATDAIAFDATAGAVQTALRANDNIGATDVVCTGGPLPATAVVVTFAAGLAGQNVPVLVGDGASLTGGTTPDVAITTVTEGYGAQKTALNAAIDTLGAAIDTYLDGVASAVEIEAMHDVLYGLGSKIADALKDKRS